MVKNNLNKIFLSASIPYLDRDRTYYDTADIVAIRDASRALATAIIPKAHLIWGGHPSITPLIRFVMERMNAAVKEHVSLYQSEFFKGKFPEDNSAFENIILTERRENRDLSLLAMRMQLIEENDFRVGIFIGGMEGVMEEFTLFKKLHPSALILPVASTGAAAKLIFESHPAEFDERLLNDYAYMSLFRDLLKDYIK